MAPGEPEFKFCLCGTKGINVGGLSAIATTFLEKQQGFLYAYLLPTCVFILGIIVIVSGKKFYKQANPRGSIFVEVGKVVSIGIRHGLENAKPSNMKNINPEMAAKITWDDTFVDELRRTFKVRRCKSLYCCHIVLGICILMSAFYRHVSFFAGSRFSGYVIPK